MKQYLTDLSDELARTPTEAPDEEDLDLDEIADA